MASTHYQRKVYRKPTNPFVGQQEKKLYQLEERRNASLRAAAEELGKVLGLTEYWTEMLPEAIYALLDQHDHSAGEIACIAFLEKRGFAVTKSD